jgi:hypothetical protein
MYPSFPGSGLVAYIIATRRPFASFEPLMDFVLIEPEKTVYLERRNEALLRPRVYCRLLRLKEV